MSMDLGFMKIGSPYAEKQQAQATEQQSELARLLSGYFRQYYPQVLEGYSGMANNAPSFIDLLRGNSAQAIQRGTNNLMSGTFAGAQQRGMMNSGQTQNMLAALAANNSRMLSGNEAQYAKMADDRRARALAALGQFSSSAGQNAGQLYGNVGNTWGNQAANAMVPFTSLMGVAGNALGGWAAGGFK